MAIESLLCVQIRAMYTLMRTHCLDCYKQRESQLQ